MGFWSRLVGREPQHEERAITTIDDYIQELAQFTYNGLGYSAYGLQQTLQGNVETAPETFEQYVQGLYKTNGIVFACILARRAVFTEARFRFRDVRDTGRGRLFGSPLLEPIERPYPGGVTANMLARMLDDVDLAGNWYGWLHKGEIIRLRPDWVDIVLEPRMVTSQGDPRGEQVGWRKVGYLYYEGGARDNPGVPFLLNEVAHWAPIPDPLAHWRGMSWLTPVIREILADKAFTTHKLSYVERGATPNMIFKLPQLGEDKLARFKAAFEANHDGPQNAFRRLFLTGGADVTVVGTNLKDMDFSKIQGGGETRVAAAAGVPPVIVGFSEGLSGSSLNQGNYSSARRNFADRTLRPLWRSAAATLEWLVGRPNDTAELTVDTTDVAFLREDEKDRADILARDVGSVRQLIDAGYTPDSSRDAVAANDLSLLVHTGLYSVQLQPAGASDDLNPETGGDADEPPSEVEEQ